MKAFNGFKSEAITSKPKNLPAGAYVARILDVKIEGEEPDQTLIIRLDVCEGEYIEYFRNRYKTEKEKKEKDNSRFEPRYKGDYRLRIPNPENKKAMYPESDTRRFNDAIYRIEQSNPGYHWDWDERGLVGKYIGINMQDAEYNGNQFTRIGRLEIVEDVRRGLVQAMRPRQPRGDADDSKYIQTPIVDKQAGFTAVETDELPF
jgi:hypothetical protein